MASTAGPPALDALRVGLPRGAARGSRRATSAAAADVADVAAELADLAAATLEAALAVARAELGEAAATCRLAVIAMGKCGGRELNYVSDVDVVFVAEPVTPTGTPRPGSAAMRTADAAGRGADARLLRHTGEGTIWPVDAALRPEGKAGPLVRTVASHVAYYERWAKTWEFQALLKARPVAGDLALGRDYLEAVAPLVWQAADRPDFVADVQAMRRRVEDTHPAAQSSHRELKLGPGGLRDVEFAVQLLQLVHGRADETLRSAEHARGARGAVDRRLRRPGRRRGRSTAPTASCARSSTGCSCTGCAAPTCMPEDPDELRRLGRSLGLRSAPGRGRWTREWRRHAREVRRLHEKLFYRPLLSSVARLAPTRRGSRRRRPRPAGGARATPTRPARCATSRRSPTGVSRRAAIQRTLLPVLLGWFADAPDPDGGLLAFRQVSDALGTTPWYLRLLRDEGAVAERLALLLATSRYAADLLVRAPEAVRMLADEDELAPRRADRSPRSWPASPAGTTTRRPRSPSRAGVRRRELLRVAAADLLGVVDVEQVGQALTDVAAATVQAALDVASRSVRRRSAAGELPTRLAVIAMGRLGGRELGYGSDADVLFVHDPVDGADEQDASEAAHAVVDELRRLLAVPAPDPPLAVDADLRPEGARARWCAAWRRTPPTTSAGRTSGRRRRCCVPTRSPATPTWASGSSSWSTRCATGRRGSTTRRSREIRRHQGAGRGRAAAARRRPGPAHQARPRRAGRRRVDRPAAAAAPRRRGCPGCAPQRPCALSRRRVTPGCSTPSRPAPSRTPGARRAASATPCCSSAAVRATACPTDLRELSGVAQVLGYPPGASGKLVDDYRRATRRARAVVEGVFYR